MKNTIDQAQATVQETSAVANSVETIKKAKKSKKEKKASKEAKASKKEKVVKAVKKEAAKNLVEEVVTQREVKYIYPEDCNDTLSRKKHRQAVRNQLHKLELEMHRIEDKNSKAFKEKKKEYEAFKAANLKKNAAA